MWILTPLLQRAFAAMTVPMDFFKGLEIYHPLPVPRPSRARGLNDTIFMTWKNSLQVHRHPVAIVRRDGVYGTRSCVGFFIITFLSAGEPIKKCAVADEKEEMCQVCRYVGSRRAEANVALCK